MQQQQAIRHQRAVGANICMCDRASRKNRPVRTQPMTQKQHLPSISDKEQRMYEHVKDGELKQGRSKKLAKEIAARTVNKHHSEEGHAKGK